MNILDIGIIIFIIFGAFLGLKRGFTRELVEAIGFIVVIVLSYFLKNPLSVLMYEFLPFFDFGILKNVEIFNILIYEAIAFLICILVLSSILKVLLLATSVFEKLLNTTIILGIPSKIAGAIVGVIHHFIVAFIILYILAIFCFDVDFVNESELKDKILNNTPLLSEIADKGVGVIEEFLVLKDQYTDQTISESEFNYKAIELFLKYDIITPDALEKLIEKGKIEEFDNYGDLIKTYREDSNGN